MKFSKLLFYFVFILTLLTGCGLSTDKYEFVIESEEIKVNFLDIFVQTNKFYQSTCTNFRIKTPVNYSIKFSSLVNLKQTKRDYDFIKSWKIKQIEFSNLQSVFNKALNGKIYLQTWHSLPIALRPQEVAFLYVNDLETLELRQNYPLPSLKENISFLLQLNYWIQDGDFCPFDKLDLKFKITFEGK